MHNGRNGGRHPLTPPQAKASAQQQVFGHHQELEAKAKLEAALSRQKPTLLRYSKTQLIALDLVWQLQPWLPRQQRNNLQPQPLELPLELALKLHMVSLRDLAYGLSTLDDAGVCGKLRTVAAIHCNAAFLLLLTQPSMVHLKAPTAERPEKVPPAQEVVSQVLLSAQTLHVYARALEAVARLPDRVLALPVDKGQTGDSFVAALVLAMNFTIQALWSLLAMPVVSSQTAGRQLDLLLAIQDSSVIEHAARATLAVAQRLPHLTDANAAAPVPATGSVMGVSAAAAAALGQATAQHGNSINNPAAFLQLSGWAALLPQLVSEIIYPTSYIGFSSRTMDRDMDWETHSSLVRGACRNILMGPCLSYCMAAGGIDALSALDGGPRYGLQPSGLLLQLQSSVVYSRPLHLALGLDRGSAERHSRNMLLRALVTTARAALTCVPYPTPQEVAQGLSPRRWRQLSRRVLRALGDLPLPGQTTAAAAGNQLQDASDVVECGMHAVACLFECCRGGPYPAAPQRSDWAALASSFGSPVLLDALDSHFPRNVLEMAADTLLWSIQNPPAGANVSPGGAAAEGSLNVNTQHAVEGGMLPALERWLCQPSARNTGKMSASKQVTLLRHMGWRALLAHAPQQQVAGLVWAMGQLLRHEPGGARQPEAANGSAAPWYHQDSWVTATLPLLLDSVEALNAATQADGSSSSAEVQQQLGLLASYAAMSWLPQLSRAVREALPAAAAAPAASASGVTASCTLVLRCLRLWLQLTMQPSTALSLPPPPAAVTGVGDCIVATGGSSGTKPISSSCGGDVMSFSSSSSETVTPNISGGGAVPPSGNSSDGGGAVLANSCDTATGAEGSYAAPTAGEQPALPPSFWLLHQDSMQHCFILLAFIAWLYLKLYPTGQPSEPGSMFALALVPLDSIMPGLAAWVLCTYALTLAGSLRIRMRWRLFCCAKTSPAKPEPAAAEPACSGHEQHDPPAVSSSGGVAEGAGQPPQQQPAAGHAPAPECTAVDVEVAGQPVHDADPAALERQLVPGFVPSPVRAAVQDQLAPGCVPAPAMGAEAGAMPDDAPAAAPSEAPAAAAAAMVQAAGLLQPADAGAEDSWGMRVLCDVRPFDLFDAVLHHIVQTAKPSDINQGVAAGGGTQLADLLDELGDLLMVLAAMFPHEMRQRMQQHGLPLQEAPAAMAAAPTAGSSTGAAPAAGAGAPAPYGLPLDLATLGKLLELWGASSSGRPTVAAAGAGGSTLCRLEKRWTGAVHAAQYICNTGYVSAGARPGPSAAKGPLALPSPGKVTARLGGCSSPACGRLQPQGPGWRACSRCSSVRYCCCACQWAHWQAGHKEACTGGS